MEPPTENFISFSKKKLISLCKERDISGISKLNRYELIALLSIDSEVDIVKPEATVPEVVEDATVPEATVPEATVPEPTVPEPTVPDAIVEDATVPEAIVEEDIVEDMSNFIIHLLLLFFTIHIFTMIYAYIRF
jgi:hypothetical protein